jgi:uncharacterized protein (TIGR03083 family)
MVSDMGAIMTVMDFTWEESRRAFEDAADWYLATVALVGDRWDEPGLGEWSVRDLVGHTSRSFVTVEEYAARPAAAVEVASPADYYLATRAIAAGPDVAQRGRDAAAALGDDPAAALAEIADRVRRLLDAHDGTALVTTIAGGMRLADYLVTRTFELTVHTADLALALNEPTTTPSTAAVQALALVAELALADGTAGSLLLLATGRTGLPTGFSVM